MFLAAVELSSCFGEPSETTSPFTQFLERRGFELISNAGGLLYRHFEDPALTIPKVIHTFAADDISRLPFLRCTSQRLARSPQTKRMELQTLDK
jgi:hypothetical protein